MNANLARVAFVAFSAITAFALPARGEKKYDEGASDTEIKIGNFSPETGWLEQYGAVARAEAAYFQMINDQGGVNGRKIHFVSLDNESSPRKSVELVHKLVEEEKVMLIFGTQGPAANLEVRPYLNERKIPQLFVASPVSTINDPEHFPWTMGFQASAKMEAKVYGQYILQNKPEAKIAVLYGNDDTGKDYVAGLREGLGEKAATMIVKETAFEDNAPSPDEQVTALKSTNADVFCNFSAGKFATQAIRKAYDLDWHPLQFIPNTSISIAAFLDPAGLEKAKDIVSVARSKGWISAESKRDPKVQAFLDWMKKYNPKATVRDANNVYGYEAAQALTEVLRKCGDDLTRANVMKQATSLDIELDMLLPGIRVKTSATDYRPIKQMYLIKFDGKNWKRFGEVVGG